MDHGKPGSHISNRIKGVCPVGPSAIWVGDFTYISWNDAFIYLATVMDLFTREIVGWHVGLHHSASLVVHALQDAKRKRSLPKVFHSDQGSEYDSRLCHAWLFVHRILPSHSAKAHPWENGHQESFFGRFKEELGDVYRFPTLDVLVEALHHQIVYYNTKRIHGALKMTPREKYAEAVQQRLVVDSKPNKKHLSTGVS